MRAATPATGRLTNRIIETAVCGPVTTWLWDGEIKGFGVRLHQSGAKSYVFQYRAGKGRDAPKRRYTLGSCGTVPLEAARSVARQMAGKVAGGGDPLAERQAEAAARREMRQRVKDAPRNSVSGLADRFIELYVKPNNRSAGEYERILRQYVLPIWGSRPIASIRRADVVALLDGIVDGTGPGVKQPRLTVGTAAARPNSDRRTMAHHVLAVVRKMFRWHQARDEGFVTPVVVGMSPLVRPSERARERILSDDELRSVWAALSTTSYPFGPLVKFLLLTAQRRDEVAEARWSEIDLTTAAWTIPAERYKTKRQNVVPLSGAAIELLTSLPSFDESCDGKLVFSTTGTTGFSGFSKSKRRLDEVCGVTGWTLHDLRRTARTLMVRAGVRSEIAERVLGHVIGGVAGVYDRHDYALEKRLAMDALAAEIERVLQPQSTSVVVMMRR